MDFSHTKRFVFSALEWAFKTIWQQLWFFCLVHLLWSFALFGAIAACIGGITGILHIIKNMPNSILSSFSSFLITMLLGAAGIAISICCAGIATWFRAGLTAIALKLYDGKPCSLTDSVPSFTIAYKSAIAAFLYGIGYALGFILFIIPGIVFLVTFAFYQQYIVDENCGILESFRKSAALTRGKRGNPLFALFATWFCIWYGGAFLFALFFGKIIATVWFVITLPISVLVYTYAYRALQKDLHSAFTDEMCIENLCKAAECE